MKANFYHLLSFLALTAMPLRADTKTEAIVAEALSSPRNVVAIIGWAALENPASAPQLAAEAIGMFPDQAVDILRALLKASPALGAEIVRAAIAVQPEKALLLAIAATNVLPGQATAIKAAALEAAPESARAGIAALTPPEEALAAPSAPSLRGAPRPAFPTQSIRPDIVSPSS